MEHTNVTNAATNDDLSDEQLAQQVQEKNDKSFDFLINRYQSKLLHYVARYASGPDEASDIVQESFIKAHTRIDLFDTTRKFSPWIYRIAHNTAVDYIAKKSRKKNLSLDETLALSDEAALANIELSSLDIWFQKELKEQMRSAISTLPDSYAQVIHLRYIEGFSYKEISDIIGKPVSTVGTLVRRAKKQLLEIILDSQDF